MQLEAAVFDIDGTLVPKGSTAPGERTVKAIQRLQQRGVAIIIATGRAPFSGRPMLGELRPDYFVGVCGNCVTDAAGAILHRSCMTPEEMYALVDYCEDYELPLGFIFEEAYYGYVEADRLRRAYGPIQNCAGYLRDGEDQVRHLQSMPMGGMGLLDARHREAFAQKYGYLGLRFLPFRNAFCDILQRDTSKAAAVSTLLRQNHFLWERTVAFGDGENDAELLREAGLGVAMEDGSETLRSLADAVAPPSAADGVGKILEERFL